MSYITPEKIADLLEKQNKIYEQNQRILMSSYATKDNIPVNIIKKFEDPVIEKSIIDYQKDLEEKQKAFSETPELESLPVPENEIKIIFIFIYLYIQESYNNFYYNLNLKKNMYDEQINNLNEIKEKLQNEKQKFDNGYFSSVKYFDDKKKLDIQLKKIKQNIDNIEQEKNHLFANSSNLDKEIHEAYKKMTKLKNET